MNQIFVYYESMKRKLREPASLFLRFALLFFFFSFFNAPCALSNKIAHIWRSVPGPFPLHVCCLRRANCHHLTPYGSTSSRGFAWLLYTLWSGQAAAKRFAQSLPCIVSISKSLRVVHSDVARGLHWHFCWHFSAVYRGFSGKGQLAARCGVPHGHAVSTFNAIRRAIECGVDIYHGERFRRVRASECENIGLWRVQ